MFWITQLCRRSGFFPPFCWRLCFFTLFIPWHGPGLAQATSKGFGFPESGSPLFVRFIHCPTERCHTTSSGISLGASHLKPIQWKPIYFIWHRLSDHVFCYGKQNIFRFCKTNNYMKWHCPTLCIMMFLYSFKSNKRPHVRQALFFGSVCGPVLSSPLCVKSTFPPSYRQNGLDSINPTKNTNTMQYGAWHWGGNAVYWYNIILCEIVMTWCYFIWRGNKSNGR